MGTKGKFLDIIKAICGKPSADIRLNGIETDNIPLRSGTRLDATLTAVAQRSTGSPSQSTEARQRNKKHPN